MRAMLVAALAVGLVGLSHAQEKRTGTPAAQIKAIEKEFTATLDKANMEIGKADPAKRAELVKAARETFGKLVKEANALAEANPNDPAAVPALAFVVARAGYTGPEGATLATAARTTLKDKYLDKPGIGNALPALAGGPDGTDLLRKVIASNKDKAAQGAATFLLGSRLVDQSERMPGAAGKGMAQEGETLLVKVEKEFKDIDLNGQTLGAQAGEKLYVVRNLAVGKVVPDVEGTDLDGKKVKLSGYRGKVVVVDIWATWCPPCRDMIPHERELVKKMEGKPFVLVSISADAKKDTLTEFIKKEPMPWTHWWDGQSGPVTKAFRVQFFPTIYVLDAKGVIRFKGVRGEAMDKAVEELLKETPGGKSQ